MDPLIPAWEREQLRQEEHECRSIEKLDWNLIVASHYESYGYIYESGHWVKREPYSQRNWDGDSA